MTMLIYIGGANHGVRLETGDNVGAARMSYKKDRDFPLDPLRIDDYERTTMSVKLDDGTTVEQEFMVHQSKELSAEAAAAFAREFVISDRAAGQSA